MKPRRLLDRTTTPDGSELSLHQRDQSFFILVDGDELMGSRMHGSEEELARLAIAARGELRIDRLLVGGLGMGFTLRAALDALDARRAGKTRVVVAELFPAVVAWNEGPLGHLAGHPLRDRRVEVAVGDLVATLATTPPFDVILLDLDNSPSAFTLRGNARLYTREGLADLLARLTPGGVLAVWSADPDDAFLDRLRKVGYRAHCHHVSARPGGRGGRHHLFVAVRP